MIAEAPRACQECGVSLHQSYCVGIIVSYGRGTFFNRYMRDMKVEQLNKYFQAHVKKVIFDDITFKNKRLT